MTKRTFQSKPENYRLNQLEGSETYAAPAWLSAPGGNEPGIVIRTGYKIKVVIPAEDAIRIANEIADSVEALESMEAA